jgi:hypothetical protein
MVIINAKSIVTSISQPPEMFIFINEPHND